MTTTTNKPTQEQRIQTTTEYVTLDTQIKELEKKRKAMAEDIKLDIIDGAVYENKTHYLLMTDPQNTIYNQDKFLEKFGLELTKEVSKIQVGLVDEVVKLGKIKKEDLGGTFHTEPGTPALKVYKGKRTPPNSKGK